MHGRLVELCTPVNKQRYGVAAQAALGRHADSVVVDSERTALDAIRYLRENSIGSATFLPLDSLKQDQGADDNDDDDEEDQKDNNRRNSTGWTEDKLRRLADGCRPAIDVFKYT